MRKAKIILPAGFLLTIFLCSCSDMAGAGNEPNPLMYKVTYDGNGSAGGETPTDAATYREGDTVTVLDNGGNLFRVDHVFSGWNTKDDGSGDAYAPGDTFAMGTSDVTLYANWLPNTPDTGTPGELEKSWGTASILFSGKPGEYNSSPRIAFDEDGNGIVVWSCDEIGLMAARYVVGAGWSAVETIAGPADKDGYNIQLSCDNNGNAIVVWMNEDLWTVRYVKGAGWGQPELLADGFLEQGTSSIGDPRLAIDGAGNAFAVWDQAEDVITIRHIRAARYTPAGGWQPAELLENGGAENGDRFARIACDSNGNFMAVWNRLDVGTGYSIASRLWVPVSGWGDMNLIEPPVVASFPAMPNLVYDAYGAFIAVWMKDGLMTSRYTTADGWGDAEYVGPVIGEYDYPGAQICADSAGDALVIIEGWGFWFAGYGAGSGWSGVEGIPGKSANEQPRFAMDSDGNAIVVYRGYHPTYKTYPIWASRYVKDNGWESEPVQIQNNPADGVEPVSGMLPDVAFNDKAKAIAVWIQDIPGAINNEDKSSSVWINVYSE